ncbi:uncharacterized protein LOC144422802 [Styela clava]
MTSSDFLTCYLCNRSIILGQTKLNCEICGKQLHLECALIFAPSDAPLAQPYFCQACLKETRSYQKFHGAFANNFKVLNELSRCRCQNIEVSDLNIISRSMSKNCFIAFHLNTGSLQKNYDELVNLLSEFATPPHLIAISETWLGVTPNSNISLNNYDFIHKPSITIAGGVGLYVSRDLFFCQIHEYDLEHPDCEDLWINLKINLNISFIIGVIYKHPRKDIIQFTSTISNVLDRLNRDKRLFILLGDWNIDLLGQSTDLATMKYIDTHLANLSLPLITKPTRVTRTSSTLIDNIFTNAINYDLSSFVILTDISDHYPQFCTVSTSIFTRRQNQIFRRDMRNFSIDLYRSDIESSILPISNCQITCDNLNILFDSFVAIIKSSIDAHAPIKPLSRHKTRLLAKPWITKGIRVSVKRKHKMYKTHFKNGTNTQYRTYKTYSNLLAVLINKAKKMYYFNRIKQVSGDIRSTWDLIGRIVNIKKERTPLTAIKTIITDNGSRVNDPLLIANYFNDYFTSIGPNLFEKIPHIEGSFLSNLKNPIKKISFS